LKKLIVFLVLGTLLLGAYWAMSRPEIISVRLTTAEKGIVEATVANTRAGTINACQRSRLSLPVGGQVSELRVKDGDHVKAGQVLLKLWNKDKQALLETARSHLAESKHAKKEVCHAADLDEREHQRQLTLSKRNLSSAEALDSAKTKAQISRLHCEGASFTIQENEAHLRLQQALYDQTILIAPFDGVVAEINGEIGEYVTPSPPGVATPPAVDLIADDCLYVQAPIDEVDAALIKDGMPVRITLDAFRGRSFDGSVKRIAPYVKDYEKQARTVDVDVYFESPPEDIELLIGYSADIEVILEQQEARLRIPTEAVLDGQRVLRFDPASSTLEAWEFTPGISNWVYTEVRSGLEEGDQILLSLDAEGAVDGAQVSPQP
jgi:HlyD family secretion protein